MSVRKTATTHNTLTFPSTSAEIVQQGVTAATTQCLAFHAA